MCEVIVTMEMVNLGPEGPVKVTLVKVSLGPWQMFVQQKPDLEIDGRPFVALTMMYHAERHEYVWRALGRLVESGQVKNIREFLSKCLKLFSNGKPCLGMKPPDANFPLSCQFASKCSIMIPRTRDSQICQACQELADHRDRRLKDPKKVAKDIIFNQGRNVLRALNQTKVRQLWTCPMCSEHLPFAKIKDHFQNDHFWTHLECFHCEERFVDAHDLRNHSLKEHPMINELFCPFCPMNNPINEDSESLERHLLDCMSRMKRAIEIDTIQPTKAEECQEASCSNIQVKYPYDFGPSQVKSEPMETFSEEDLNKRKTLWSSSEEEDSDNDPLAVNLPEDAFIHQFHQADRGENIQSTPKDNHKMSENAVTIGASEDVAKSKEEPSTNHLKTLCHYCLNLVFFRSLSKHHMFRHQVGDFKCPECPQIFPKAEQVVEHLRFHPGVHQLMCPNCQQVLSSEDLNDHISTCHRLKFQWDTETNRLVQFFGKECIDCNESFDDEEELQEHESANLCCKWVRKPTKVKKKGKISTKQHVCTDCKEGFRTKDKSRDHESLVRGKRYLSCENCGMEFKSEGYLQRHINRDHAMSDDLKCRDCNFIGNLSQLKTHKKIHRERNLLCTICGKSSS